MSIFDQSYHFWGCELRDIYPTQKKKKKEGRIGIYKMKIHVHTDIQLLNTVIYWEDRDHSYKTLIHSFESGWDNSAPLVIK